mmetsp:Transcript_5141/g.5265  ORF Transcript_5141/g.5265 Transcript_5141/m.5265 type:complete len:470 (-) Transcript_5141:31-1440(-)
MGCTISYQYTIDPSIVGRNQEATDLLKSLSLSSSDLDILFTAFADIDADDSGTIRFDELFAYFRIEPTKFNETVFGYCDVDHRGYLTFLDFVIGIWLYLTVDQNELGGYAFILFDIDYTGVLDSEEILNLIHVIHNKTTIQSKAILQVVDQLKGSKEVFSCEKFQNWTRTHYSLLEPAQTLQINLRKNLIGEAYWLQKTKFRKEHKEFSNLAYIYDLKRKVYEVQKKQVLLLIEQRIMQRRRNEFDNKHQQRIRGQRTTALLEFFNLAKGDKNKTIEKLGLAQRKKKELFPSIKRKEPDKRYRVMELEEDIRENRHQIHENHQKSNISIETESKDNGFHNLNDEHENYNNNQSNNNINNNNQNNVNNNVNNSNKNSNKYDHFNNNLSNSPQQINHLESTSSKDQQLNQIMEENVDFNEILVCPEKQRRRRSSFLIVKPRLLLKSELAKYEITKKNHPKKKGQIVPEKPS